MDDVPVGESLSELMLLGWVGGEGVGLDLDHSASGFSSWMRTSMTADVPWGQNTK